MPWTKIPGWFDYRDIYDHAVATAESGHHFVEIGSHQGRSTAYLAQAIVRSGKRVRLDACDVWTDCWYQVWSDNMARAGVSHRVNPLHMLSTQAAGMYEVESLDFIFIDAGHSYESVAEDVRAWFPKLKKGRLIAGHDYRSKEFPGVEKAVDEFFEGRACPQGNSWVYRKP